MFPPCRSDEPDNAEGCTTNYAKREPFSVQRMRFEGQTALVTGGARGIGAATADASPRRARALWSPTSTGTRPRSGPVGRRGRRPLRRDSREDVEAAVAAAVERTGRLDIAVTCAGIIRDNLVHKLTDDDWSAVIDTHLRGTFLTVQAAQRHMVEQKSGKLVLISSTSALGNRGQLELLRRKDGDPGDDRARWRSSRPVRGQRQLCRAGVHRDRDDRADRRAGRDPVRGVRRACRGKQTPLRRIGHPDDVAGVIAFLCSEDASFVSGQVVYVRGGP